MNGREEELEPARLERAHERGARELTLLSFVDDLHVVRQHKFPRDALEPDLVLVEDEPQPFVVPAATLGDVREDVVELAAEESHHLVERTEVVTDLLKDAERLRQLSSRGKRLVDGYGTERILRSFLERVGEESSLRLGD